MMSRTVFERSCGVLLASVLLALPVAAAGSDEQPGEQPIPLWATDAPAAAGDGPQDRPAVWVYRPREDPNGTAVIICPGGGYAVHAVDHEGTQPARWLNRMGVTVFVLRYRLAPYRHPVPLQDAQRAVRFVRAHASEYSVDQQRIGIMGFSAGGHLASTAATHFDQGDSDSTDPVERMSCRPDFLILGYPVVSFQDGVTHRGSLRNLLGETPAEEVIDDLSNELRVTPQTPPTFLFHTFEDAAVNAENSLRFARACREAGVPVELHAFQHGQHGVGLANEHPALSQWIQLAGTWLRQNGLLTSLRRHALSGVVTVAGEPLPWGAIRFEPVDASLPVGWSMVMRGQYRIPESAGIVAGQYRVRVIDMGDVSPEPTVDDARALEPSPEVIVSAEQTTLDIAL